MNTINITTSQNIDVEYELASLGDRLLGWIIDWVILGAYIILLIIFSNFGSFTGNSYWLMIFLVLPIFFYDLLCEILLNGQSMGKRIMGIRVVSLNGAQPSFSQYLIRWLFRIVDFSLFWGLVAFIMVAATEKKQRLGDLVAGTTLVKTRPRTQFSQTIYEPVLEQDYQVTYPEVVNLGDTDIQLVREILVTVTQTGNTMLALQAQRKIEQILNITSRNSEPKIFLQVVLADFNHVTAAL